MSSARRPGSALFACPRRACARLRRRPYPADGGPSGSRLARGRPRARSRRRRLSPRASGARPRAARPGRASGSSRCRRRSGQAGAPCQPACSDLGSLLAAVDAVRPDVVVTDVRMPPGDADEGIQAAERLRETNPDVGVVVLSQYANPSYVLALLERGSAGRAYLLKERVKDLEQLVTAIRAVAEGGSVIDPKVVEALVAENARGEESPVTQLTPRERDVLREMAEGKNNAAIADAVFLTERSVEKVIHSISLKLRLTWEPAVHKRVKAVIMYLAESDQVHPADGREP